MLEKSIRNFMVGVRGFEPPASWSRTKHSTKLSHTPKKPIRILTASILYTILFQLSTVFRQNFAEKKQLMYRFGEQPKGEKLREPI